MSRIGNKAIVIPGDVKFLVNDDVVTVAGPLGAMTMALVRGINATQQDNELHVKRDSDDRRARANHGLVRALLANMVKGVSEGFEKRLEIRGVGYKAEVKGQELTMALGYSHPVVFAIPDGVRIVVTKGTDLLVKGIDRQAVGQVAAVIRGYRPPDSYKGKGIRYVGEEVRIKAGKSAN